jgi:hypothetical protein
LTVSATNGTVSKSSVTVVSLAFNPAGLNFGAYNFTLHLNTGDPSLPVTSLPVSLTIPPPAPQLQALTIANRQLVLQLQGIAGLSYLLETSPDLINWMPASTNKLTDAIVGLTNTIPPGARQQFWRALWQP